MKIFLKILIMISFMCGCGKQEAKSTVKQYNSNINILEIKNHFGKYEIKKFKEYGGGITTIEFAQSLINSEVLISTNLFKIRDEEIYDPKYKISVIQNKKHEGDISSRDLSIFYGFQTDRENVYLLSVYKNGQLGAEPYISLEILDNGQYLEMYDGKFYFIN